MKSQHCRVAATVFLKYSGQCDYHRVQVVRFSGPKTEVFSLRQAMCRFPSLLFVIFPFAIASKLKKGKSQNLEFKKVNNRNFGTFGKSVRQCVQML